MTLRMVGNDNIITKNLTTRQRNKHNIYIDTAGYSDIAGNAKKPKEH